MISQTAEYALRAVVHLATLEKSGSPSQTVMQIAEGTRVPAGYLAKVLQVLSRTDLIVSQRGLGGGFRLGKSAGLLVKNHASRAVRISGGIILGIVVLQSAWLLPVLDARVEMILQKQTPPPAPFHLLYIGLEGLKLGGLLAAGFLSLRSLQTKHSE